MISFHEGRLKFVPLYPSSNRNLQLSKPFSSECFEAIKKLDTKSVPSNFEDIKKSLWEIVDLLKDKHDYVHFFLNSQMVKTYYDTSQTKYEQIDFIIFLFSYYADLQNLYRDALKICLLKKYLLNLLCLKDL